MLCCNMFDNKFLDLYRKEYLGGSIFYSELLLVGIRGAGMEGFCGVWDEKRCRFDPERPDYNMGLVTLMV